MGSRFECREVFEFEGTDKVSPQFLAGHLALDFVINRNTRMRVGRELPDVLETDEDVLAWLHG